MSIQGSHVASLCNSKDCPILDSQTCLLLHAELIQKPTLRQCTYHKHQAHHQSTIQSTKYIVAGLHIDIFEFILHASACEFCSCKLFALQRKIHVQEGVILPQLPGMQGTLDCISKWTEDGELDKALNRIETFMR